MGDFRSVAQVLRRAATRPTRQQQQAARIEALQPVKAEAALIVEANGNVETRKYIESFGFAHLDDVTTATGPQRGAPHATLGHLLEFGTAPHWQPQRQRMHPGARAFPHWRPAFDMTKGQVVARLGQTLSGILFR